MRYRNDGSVRERESHTASARFQFRCTKCRRQVPFESGYAVRSSSDPLLNGRSRRREDVACLVNREIYLLLATGGNV